VEVEIENINPEQTVIADLAELSHKTGLMVRAVGPATVDRLFAEIEKYEEQETSGNLLLSEARSKRDSRFARS